MIWARWAGVMGSPMKWEIARIFVVGTGGSGFCAEAAPSGVIGFFCIWIGFLNDLFYGRSYSAGPGKMSIPFLVDEKPTVVPTGSAGERSGGAREMFDRQSKKRKWVSYEG